MPTSVGRPPTVRKTRTIIIATILGFLLLIGASFAAAQAAQTFAKETQPSTSIGNTSFKDLASTLPGTIMLTKSELVTPEPIVDPIGPESVTPEIVTPDPVVDPATTIDPLITGDPNDPNDPTNRIIDPVGEAEGDVTGKVVDPTPDPDVDTTKPIVDPTTDPAITPPVKIVDPVVEPVVNPTPIVDPTVDTKKTKKTLPKTGSSEVLIAGSIAVLLLGAGAALTARNVRKGRDLDS